MHKIILLACCFCAVTANAQIKEAKHTYLALGDSYTIGESVEPQMRWPNLLADSLNEAGYRFASPIIIAKTGWRTDELITAIKSEEKLDQFDLVSILIGVNNQYQGKGIKVFQNELKEIIQLAIHHSKNGASGVFAVSIPDYGVTPFANSKNPEKISREIASFNSVYQKICEQNNISFYNITPISIEAKNNLQLLATDLLHPSGLMYQRWVSLLLEEVETFQLSR